MAETARVRLGRGRRLPARRTRVGAAARAALVVVGALLLGACGGPSPDSINGSLPRYLPASSLHPDGVLIDTSVRPALTSEGDSVQARTAQGTVLATVAGPEVPGEGLPYRAPATTCTWIVTLADATRPMPIRIGEFTTIEQFGTIYHPRPVVSDPRPPAMLEPGRTVTFDLRVVMRTGEGLMRWAPDGRHIVARWDFEVEVD